MCFKNSGGRKYRSLEFGPAPESPIKGRFKNARVAIKRGLKYNIHTYAFARSQSYSVAKAANVNLAARPCSRGYVVSRYIRDLRFADTTPFRGARRKSSCSGVKSLGRFPIKSRPGFLGVERIGGKE